MAHRHQITPPSPAVLRGHGGPVHVAHIDLTTPHKKEFDQLSTNSTVSSFVYLSNSKDASAPYTDVPLPPYSVEDKHDPCVAELCFKYGFVFFPLWIYAATLLRKPHELPPLGDLPFMPALEASEKRAHLYDLRQEELIWARKSLKALIVFIFVAIVTVSLALGIHFGLKQDTSSEPVSMNPMNQMPHDKVYNYIKA